MSKEINDELKKKDLSKEDKKKLKEEREILQIEKEGNKVVGEMLKALDKIGERNGLTLKDFTLSTDSKKDFAGRASAEEMKSILESQAFNSPALNTMLIRTETSTGLYQLGRRGGDYVYPGAAILRHEQTHKLQRSVC